MPTTRHITEATVEQIADKMVWERLATDSAYNNAEDAEAQSSREEEIAAKVWAELEEKYVIGDGLGPMEHVDNDGYAIHDA